MPLISTLALAPVLLKTGGASLAACAPTASFATGATTAAVGGGAAGAGTKVLGLAMLTKGVSSAAKSGALTKAGTGTVVAHAAAAPALAAGPMANGAALAADASRAVVVPAAATGAPAIAAAPATQITTAAAGTAALPTAATGAASGGAAAAAPAASGYGKHLTMVATVLGIMVLRALANRYWLATPAQSKSRLVRRVSRWSKEEEVAVEADEEFGQIPQLPFKDECVTCVEAGTGAAASKKTGREEGSRVSATATTDAGLTDIETTASTLKKGRRRVSYVRRAKGKLHKFL